MELEKVKIHRIQQNGTAVSQITLDDDYNVPDYRPDIMKVLKENGELRFDEVKAANKAVWVKGSLVFHILYQCEQSDGKISCLKGEIPFQEKLNIDGLQENGEVHAAGEIEDLTVGVINSRNRASVRWLCCVPRRRNRCWRSLRPDWNCRGITSRRREPGERSICSHPAGMSAGRRVRLFCRRTNPMCGKFCGAV